MPDENEPPPVSKLTRSKQRWAREGRFLTGKTSRPEEQRLPPGQHLTKDWPILDLGLTGGLFDVVSQPAAERLLTPPHADRATVWALATAACLVSGDYRKAREPASQLAVT